MAKTSVRVSMFREPIEVDEAEIPNLRTQGLLVEDEAPAGGKAGRKARNEDTGNAAGESSTPDGTAPPATTE
jgi:hypothetical protein